MYIRLNSPVPVVCVQRGVLVEESRLPTNHGVVAEHMALANPDRAQVVEAIHVACG